MNPCPVCESSEAPKFDGQSDWCVECVERELDVQAVLDSPKQDRQYV